MEKLKAGDKVVWIKEKPTQKDWNGIVLKVYEDGSAAIEWHRADGGGKLTVSVRQPGEFKAAE